MADPLPQPITYGDTSGDLTDHTQADSQSLFDTGTLVGDADALLDHAVGGDDTLSGLPTDFPGSPFPDPNSSVVVGDAITITDHARGGNDQISGPEPIAYGDAITLSGHAQGGDDSVASLFPFPQVGLTGTAYGDADTITDFARGGNDTVVANTAFGDAATINGHGQGGNDNVTAGGSLSSIGYGDAFTITDKGRGGDDVLTLTSDGQLYGDAHTLSGNAVGGNDTLTAPQTVLFPGATPQLYGDGLELLDNAKGGNDTLISGPNNDQMWGDAANVAPTAQTGADTFVFSSPNGHDQIMDFQPGQDHIDLKGYEDITNFSQLAPHISDTAAGAVITFDANDSILVANDHNLTASDFFFT